MEHFLTDMSNRVEHQKLNQLTAELPPGWVFGGHWLIFITYSYIIIVIWFIIYRFTGNWSNLRSACVCRRPSCTPQTQPGGSSAVTWLSFWCSTRLLMSVKKCSIWRRKGCKPRKKPEKKDKKLLSRALLVFTGKKLVGRPWNNLAGCFHYLLE